MMLGALGGGGRLDATKAIAAAVLMWKKFHISR